MVEKNNTEDIVKMVEGLGKLLKGLDLKVDVGEKNDKKEPEENKDPNVDVAALFGTILGKLNNAQNETEGENKKEQTEDVDVIVSRVMVAVEPELRALIEGVIRNA